MSKSAIRPTGESLDMEVMLAFQGDALHKGRLMGVRVGTHATYMK